jgi:hypothetical protein
MRTPRDTFRQIVVISSTVFALIGSFAGSGAAGGIPIQDAAGGALGAAATLIAPDVPAFSIWGPIYLGLMAYAVWQALPAQTEATRHRALGYPVAASLVLNAAWILSIQFDLLWASVPIIALLLAVLVRIFLIYVGHTSTGIVESIVTDGTMGLYLGWVCVATAANVTAALVAAGFTGWGYPAELWAVTVVAVAAIAGVIIAWRGRGKFAPAFGLSWGLAWLAVGRLTGGLLSLPVAIAAIIAVALVVGVTLIFRLRRKTTAAAAAEKA